MDQNRRMAKRGGSVLWKCNSWFHHPNCARLPQLECMKNYKSAPQLKYFRLNALKCAIENSYLCAPPNLHTPFFLFYTPKICSQIGERRAGRYEYGWYGRRMWQRQGQHRCGHICALCVAQLPASENGYWLLVTGWLVATDYCFLYADLGPRNFHIWLFLNACRRTRKAGKCWIKSSPSGVCLLKTAYKNRMGGVGVRNFFQSFFFFFLLRLWIVDMWHAPGITYFWGRSAKCMHLFTDIVRM